MRATCPREAFGTISTGKDKNKWHKAVFSDGRGTEKPENLVLLNLLAHRLHYKALFALDPCGVNKEKTELRIKFWWLKMSRSLGPTILSKILTSIIVKRWISVHGEARLISPAEKELYSWFL
ncbi:similar to An11g04970 [Aspergillus luchuensis]|uniref:Similar to An11g04970 n=1 Tax=Aspergillus kawachii TaxID=1069201 RepID=A0A146F8Q2_ASPKA|nr:similar to An11g04970 [Aspergillus luchuensis]